MSVHGVGAVKVISSRKYFSRGRYTLNFSHSHSPSFSRNSSVSYSLKKNSNQKNLEPRMLEVRNR